MNCSNSGVITIFSIGIFETLFSSLELKLFSVFFSLNDFSAGLVSSLLSVFLCSLSLSFVFSFSSFFSSFGFDAPLFLALPLLFLSSFCSTFFSSSSVFLFCSSSFFSSTFSGTFGGSGGAKILFNILLPISTASFGLFRTS